MLWGKNRELIDDQRTRCRQPHRADGLDLLIIVALQFGPECKVSGLFFLLSLQPRLPVIADRCRTQRLDLVRTDHTSLHSSHSRPRIALTRMMRIIVRIAAIVLFARAIKSLVSGLVGSQCGCSFIASCSG